MSKSPKRVRQVADVIRHELALILKREVRDPRLSHVTITSVNVSPDLKNAKIFFSMPEDSVIKEVNKAFFKCTPFIRRQLAGQVELRYVPQLHFVYDKALVQGSKITALIDEALTKDSKAKDD